MDSIFLFYIMKFKSCTCWLLRKGWGEVDHVALNSAARLKWFDIKVPPYNIDRFCDFSIFLIGHTPWQYGRRAESHTIAVAIRTSFGFSRDIVVGCNVISIIISRRRSKQKWLPPVLSANQTSSCCSLQRSLLAQLRTINEHRDRLFTEIRSLA